MNHALPLVGRTSRDTPVGAPYIVESAQMIELLRRVERPRRITSPFHTALDRLQALLGRLRVLLGRLRALPGRLRALPDRLHVLLGRLHVAPARRHMVPGRLHALAVRS